MTETVIAEIDDRQAVDLADALSGRVDQQRLALDRIDDALLRSRQPSLAMPYRLDHVVDGNLVGFPFASTIVCFEQQVVQRTYVGRQALAVAGQARPLFDDTAHCRFVERQ